MGRVQLQGRRPSRVRGQPAYQAKAQVSQKNRDVIGQMSQLNRRCKAEEEISGPLQTLIWMSV